MGKIEKKRKGSFSGVQSRNAVPPVILYRMHDAGWVACQELKNNDQTRCQVSAESGAKTRDPAGFPPVPPNTLLVLLLRTLYLLGYVSIITIPSTLDSLQASCSPCSPRMRCYATLQLSCLGQNEKVRTREFSWGGGLPFLRRI